MGAARLVAGHGWEIDGMADVAASGPQDEAAGLVTAWTSPSTEPANAEHPLDQERRRVRSAWRGPVQRYGPDQMCLVGAVTMCRRHFRTARRADPGGRRGNVVA